MTEARPPAGQFGRVVGAVVRVERDGREIAFFVKNKDDVIQRHHFGGQFYEEEELAIIAKAFPPGGVYCDIGANVGNHAIYVAKFLDPVEMILFEPNPMAIFILRTNLALNGVMEKAELSGLGYGLSDRNETLAVQLDNQNNLGGARLDQGAGETRVQVKTGDELLAGRRVDFLKIDVEGMELAVLAGLKDTLERQTPKIFIEVDDKNAKAFQAWCGQNNYRILERFRRYQWNENYLIAPS